MELTLRDLIYAGVLLVGVAGTYFRLKAQADKNCREITKQSERIDSIRKVLFSGEGEMLVCTTRVCKEERLELKDVIKTNQQAADLVGQDVQEIKQLIILIAHELKIDMSKGLIHERRPPGN